MLNIPEKVKIAGIPYTVKFMDRVDNREDIGGLQVSAAQEIHIKNSLGKEHIEMVFLHECLHALYEHMCLEHDEDIIRKLGHALHMFIKDNSEIFCDR